MGLIDKIIEKSSEFDGAVNLCVIYSWFPEEKKTTIRGRIYDNIGKKVSKIAKGLYLFLNATANIAFFKNSDSRLETPILITNRIRFDLIFLDPPYDGAGQRGGRRLINKFPLISISDWYYFIKDMRNLLRDENSQIYLMATDGVASRKTIKMYLKCMENFFTEAASGTYTKLDYSGNPCKFGQYDMPPELINVYSSSGDLRVCSNDFRLNFSEIRPYGKYPTQKPYSMIRQIVKQSTVEGMSCFDPFAGSGVFQEACLELRRFCYSIDLVSEPKRELIC